MDRACVVTICLIERRTRGARGPSRARSTWLIDARMRQPREKNLYRESFIGVTCIRIKLGCADSPPTSTSLDELQLMDGESYEADALASAVHSNL
ncbi:hypothetical protein EVAR_46001_1 [Eumeta japonica]|uniref:Uncharacterized protein n=1 Tax=Eumeta variegata TaxID=151549 RepID=A0A4C1X8Y5_EUMVA|nr:hypothetical protein EVAR_46001_1 [Eumeta japonica]